jgi:hypothetical protein
VGVIPAGGGAAAAAKRRPGAKHCAGGRRKQSRAARARGRRREGRGLGGLFGNFKNSRDFLVKKDFPLIYRFNEKMPKMKVGEFFKLYNIVLGLNFRNPKLIALHV